MTSMVSLDKLKDYDRGAEVHNLVRDADIEHRELMALAAKEIKRHSIDPLVEENAKLREFASGMYGLLEMFDQLMGTDDNLGTPRPLLFGDGRSFRDVARELGIEVG